MTEDVLTQRIEELVAVAPPLSDEQRLGIQTLLSGRVNPDPLLKRSEAAVYLGTTERHLRYLTDSGRLSVQLVGRLRRWRRSDLDAFLRAGHIEAGVSA